MSARQLLTLTVADLCAELNISRATAYDLANTPGFPVVRIGRRMIVPRAELERWLAEQAGAGSAAE